jgi:hypothetical protein
MATKKASKKAAKAQKREVVLSVPDLGLSKKQLDSLKNSFHNELVSSLGAKMAAVPRIVIIRIRIVRAEA